MRDARAKLLFWFIVVLVAVAVVLAFPNSSTGRTWSCVPNPMYMHVFMKEKSALDLSADVIKHDSTIWGHYIYVSSWRRDRHFTWSSEPREGLATGRTKTVPSFLSWGWFPLSRNFYVRTCVKFRFANKIEAMYERSHVSAKVEPHSTSRLISTFYILPSILFIWLKFACVNVRSQKRVSGNQPLL